jgi:hypothetical protein
MPTTIPRCQVIPEPDDQVSFTVDGQQRLRWHSGVAYPRPFFYPLIGPRGAVLTRMGHPGAPDHDHHRSIWFAHEKVLGINFWTDHTPARIRQKQWLAYQDGDDEAVMAVMLGWFDGHDPRELLTQQLVAAVRPLDNDETLLELQSTFTPVAESLELGKTNFGFLAVRMAKTIAAHFGGGTLQNSEKATGEPAIFGKPARWVDYSGPVRPVAATPQHPSGGKQNEPQAIAGITYIDHPQNPGYPTHWHVREDGWMGASFNFARPYEIRRDKPLVLRYLLHAHGGELQPARADAIAAQFNNRPPWEVIRSTKRHMQFEVRRKS